MSDKSESKKFRSQFHDEEWSKLMKDTEFNIAWDSGDFVKAGELASAIMFGDAHTKREAKKIRRSYIKNKEASERFRKASELFRFLTDGDKHD
jgi:hypothetical protein